MRWLALDIGSRRVGVAVCDREERVATPLPAVPFDGAARLAVVVGRIVEERGIGGVVVGVPTTRLGRGRGEARVIAVVAELRSRLAVPVETVDERGSTLLAETLLRDAGVPARRRPALIDGVAAQVILECHLEARRIDSDVTVDRREDGC